MSDETRTIVCMGETSRRVAQVAVDVPLAHLDRPFDYLIPDEFAADVRPGVRVRVRFAGRLRGGYVLDVADQTDRADVQPLYAVVSPEVVLTAKVATLVRQVADHYAGSFADVVRLAVPPRHATTEKAVPPTYPSPAARLPADAPERYACLPGYRYGQAFLDALLRGERPRAAWTALPRAGSPTWTDGLLDAAETALASGRGALLLVPDQRDLDRLSTAAAERFGKGTFAVLKAEAGPAARYRAFLSVSRGQASLVLGTRGAVFAPVRDLGLIALWDDGDDSYAEPRAPSPHAREVAALRAHLASCALLLGSYSRSAEVQALVERGWLVPVDQATVDVRAASPLVRVAADNDGALARDPLATAARLPHDVFTAIRAGLAAGPVLIQVPRSGYVPALACATCRELARCPRCGQPLEADGQAALRRDGQPYRPTSAARPSSSDSGSSPPRDRVSTLACRWCGPLPTAWACPTCGDHRVRSVAVGVRRTAEEFGKAFPGAAVVQSSGERVISDVGEEPALVLATPGAEPLARGGYAAAVLLDADALLRRPDLRAAEEALRRWLAATSLVRSAVDGGSVLIVGAPRERAIQALVRLDPAGFAARELADRREAKFPPAVKLVALEGEAGPLSDAFGLMELPPSAVVNGPFEVPFDVQTSRLTLRAPLSEGAELVAAVRQAMSVRAARKLPGSLRVRVDPSVIS